MNSISSNVIFIEVFWTVFEYSDDGTSISLDISQQHVS